MTLLERYHPSVLSLPIDLENPLGPWYNINCCCASLILTMRSPWASCYGDCACRIIDSWRGTSSTQIKGSCSCHRNCPMSCSTKEVMQVRSCYHFWSGRTLYVMEPSWESLPLILSTPPITSPRRSATYRRHGRHNLKSSTTAGWISSATPCPYGPICHHWFGFSIILEWRTSSTVILIVHPWVVIEKLEVGWAILLVVWLIPYKVMGWRIWVTGGVFTGLK